MATKHDSYVEQLCQVLGDQYDSLETHVPLLKGRNAKKLRTVAEIDIVAQRENSIHVYEVKCSHRIVKARKQLERIRRITGATKTFFFCGESGQLMLMGSQGHRVISLEEVAMLK